MKVTVGGNDIHVPEGVKLIVPAADLPRKIQRRVGHDKWQDVKIMDLTSGCTFRMFESTGEPVVDNYGHTEWVAASKPFLDKNGYARIRTY